jgi:hypothetical protein
MKRLPVDARKRHFFRVVAATCALIPLALSQKAQADSILGGVEKWTPPRRRPGGKIWVPPRRRPPGRPSPHCLMPGTRVLTNRGEVLVEHLGLGDMVKTVSGAFEPIKGIGRNVFRQQHTSWSEDNLPVRISQSAVSPGMPARDLYLSPAHALLIDDYLIPVKYLVNGMTITQEEVPPGDMIEYIHLVFERHEVFYAEGTPVESLLVDQVGKISADLDQFDGSIAGPMVSYAPLLGYFGGRQEALALARLAIYPWIDVRDRIQMVYDQLLERALQLDLEANEISLAA